MDCSFLSLLEDNTLPLMRVTLMWVTLMRVPLMRDNTDEGNIGGQRLATFSAVA
jgi:hypothetical protein